MSGITRPVAKLAMLYCLGLFALLAVPLSFPSELRGQAREEIDFPFNDLENAGHREELTAAQIAALFAFYGVVFALCMAIVVLICYGLYGFLKALPPEFRLMEPAMVWLMLIPCFNLVWIFFVYLPPGPTRITSGRKDALT